LSGTAQPAGPQEAAALFGAPERPVAIAVSGGADSMALMHLAAGWWRGHAASPAPLVLTVDHGLRPDSAGEALFVASEAGKLGLDHETLAWAGPKPSSGIQDAARRARYQLLLDRLARDRHARDLLLAHHQEDQAETLLMRLARGSGVDGLSAMRPVERRIAVVLGAPVREVAIAIRRPLLDWPKARLIATLQARNACWREDPSNADLRFERVRLRQAHSMLTGLGLEAVAVARAARRLGADREALQARTRAIAAVHVHDHDGAYGTFDIPADHGWMPADITRVAARLLDVFGGEAPPAQLSQIEALTERIMAGGKHALGRSTLGGCLLELETHGQDGRRLTIFREWSRQPLPAVTLAPAEGMFWDRRFYISVAPEAPGPVTIGPLGADGARKAASQLPQHSLAGLPAISTGGVAALVTGGHSPYLECSWPPQHAAAIRWLETI
jgi:tRNA(Ile)-lysidine synthase